MRLALFAIVVAACAGDGGEDEPPDASVPTGCTARAVAAAGCIPNGLAGLVFDGTPWRLVGTKTETRFGPPMTTPVDEMVPLLRTGTGCKHFAVGPVAPFAYVDDTVVRFFQAPEGARVPEIYLTMCMYDDGLHYERRDSGFQMQTMYTIAVTGTLTR